MDVDARENYQLWSAGQRRILQAAERKCREDRERLERDEIAALMRALDCRECGYPVTDCRCEKQKPAEDWI